MEEKRLCSGKSPPPRITLPGSTSSTLSHVTLLCQGPGQAEVQDIKVGSPEPMEEEEQITPRKTNTLSIAGPWHGQGRTLHHCSLSERAAGPSSVTPCS